MISRRRIYISSDRVFATLLVGCVAIFSVVVISARPIDTGILASERAKGLLAAVALALLAWERRRRFRGTPIPQSRVKAAGLTLAAIAVALWFSGGLFSYSQLFHAWDQFHYVVGSKYFRELGYDGLYRCSVAALVKTGRVTTPLPHPAISQTFDLRREAMGPGSVIRDLHRGNELIPISVAIADSTQCTSRFSRERWDAFTHDVIFFRLSAGAMNWSQIVRDHGYNPPPTWTAIGGSIAGLRPASREWMIILALIDPLLILGSFAALWWAFGWRTASIGAVFWGTQAFSPFFWTGGAFLRQDWFFLTVLSVCLAKRRHHGWAGASLAAAATLRIFPVLLAVGWLVMLLDPRTRSTRRHGALRAITGGLVAGILLLGLGAAVTGPAAYPAFVRHLMLHNATPLTNEMGLRPLVSARLAQGPASGRVEYVRDVTQADPVAKWKEMRLERWHQRAALVWFLAAILLVPFVMAVRRTQRTWIAPGLSTLCVVIGAQLTGYYYTFLVVAAPLARITRSLEWWLLGAAAASQLASAVFGWTDDRHLAFSAIGLALVIATNTVIASIGKRKNHSVEGFGLTVSS